MADTFKNVENKSNPADRWFAITPGATELSIVPRGLVCTADGNVTIEDAAGTSMQITGLKAGAILALRPVKVTAATGTFYGVY